MSYTEFPCDICGCNDAVEVPYARLYTADQPVHICKECGFVYVRNRRDFASIADGWTEDMYKGGKYTARIPAVLARQIYSADFLDLAVPLKGKKVVDVGAGEGQFSSILRDNYGADVFGIEPSEGNCATLDELGIAHEQGTVESFLENNPDAKGTFDVATVTWTLENCSSCKDFLEGVYALLKDGGHLLVATGSRILVPYKKRLDDYLNANDADLNSFRFSANTLRGILAMTGFKTVEINRYRDTDYLCVVGQKQPEGTEIAWKGDSFMEVHHFFERWHTETMYFWNK